MRRNFLSAMKNHVEQAKFFCRRAVLRENEMPTQKVSAFYVELADFTKSQVFQLERFPRQAFRITQKSSFFDDEDFARFVDVGGEDAHKIKPARDAFSRAVRAVPRVIMPASAHPGFRKRADD